MNLKNQLVFFLSFFFVLHLFAQSNEENINASFSQIPLSEAIKKIESVSKYTFFYDSKKIDLAQKVSLPTANLPLQNAIKQLLSNTNIEFEIKNLQIVLYPKTETHSANTPLRRITGVVRDASGETVIGASVTVKGTSNGAITDINGKYSLNASSNDVLVFSYIGMNKEEIPVLNRSDINVTLQSSVTQLSEVVAIGYGSVKKSDLTGSVALVSGKELTRNPSMSAAQAIQGKAPGVLVFENGAPGGGATIRVRGVGSINKGSDPIYIVDGVQVGDISSIQPDEIDNLQVLKDASASAIYGANGSNGVVIINTKRGKAGKVQVNLDSYVGTVLAPKQYDIMNADQYAAFYTDVYTNYKHVPVPLGYQDAFRQKYYGPDWHQGTNWQNLMFNNGLNQNYHLSMSGGGDNSNISVALGYVNEKGNVIKTSAEKYNLRVNSDLKVGKYFKFGENAETTYKIQQSPMTVQAGIYDLNASPLMKVYNSYYLGGFESPNTMYWYDTNGNLQQGPYPAGFTGDVISNTGNNDKPSPYAAPSLGNNWSYNLASRASVYMQVIFTDWLNYKLTPAVEFNTGRGESWLPLFQGNRSPNNATLNDSYYLNITLNLENQLTFEKTFNNAHNLQATAVYQIRSINGNSIGGTATGFDFEQLNTLSNGNTKNVTGGTSDFRMLSYLGRVMYNYKGKYFATGSFRSDGISLFAPAYRRGNFASGSVAWKINEDFFKNVQNLDALKLRLGWGQTGNSNIGGGFQYLDQITGATEFSPVFGTDQHIARAQYVFTSMGSPEIHWETAVMSNLGVDLNMFDNRLQATAEYYIKNNNDLLVQVPISSIFGRDAQPWFNTGKIQNRGVELSLQWRDHIGDFNYGFISNFSTIKNEVLYLPVSDITTQYNRTIVGHSIGALYGFVSDGIIQLNESNYAKDANGNWQKDASGNYIGYKHALQNGNIPQPGDIRFRDLNGDGKVDNLDKTIIGKTIPSFNYSLGFDCSYKNFDFNLFLYGVGDFYIYNYQRAVLSSMNTQDMDHNKLNSYAQNHWTEANASTTYVRIDPANVNLNDQISSFWIENGSFLRVKDVQIGYRLSKNTCKALGVTSIKFYVNASNLYCFTSYKGRDPESFISSNPLSGGTDAGGYTIPHSYTGGLHIEF